MDEVQSMERNEIHEDADDDEIIRDYEDDQQKFELNESMSML